MEFHFQLQNEIISMLKKKKKNVIYIWVIVILKKTVNLIINVQKYSLE